MLLSPGVVAQSNRAADYRYVVAAQGKTSEKFSLGWVRADKIKQADAGKALSGFRGHGVIRHRLRPDNCIMFARRPGMRAIEANLKTGQVQQAFKCRADRHLLGHGCFNKTGSKLYTTELDYQTGQGKIAVRDAQTYQWLGEFSSHGVGPHELKLLPDGNTLVVANGGIRTHPDSGRKKLNLGSMESRLTYIDIETGALVDEVQVAESKASIRHLDVAADGTVAFGMQVQRKAAGHNKVVSLAGFHERGAAVQLCEHPDTIIDIMRDYVGSVAVNSRSRIAGFSSPRGNIVAFWNMDTLQFAGYHSLYDVCGLAVTEDQRHFVLSNSAGQIRFLNADNLQEVKEQRLTVPGMHWDNHLIVASV